MCNLRCREELELAQQKGQLEAVSRPFPQDLNSFWGLVLIQRSPKKWYFWIIYLAILYFCFYFSLVNLGSIIGRQGYVHSEVFACLSRFINSYLNATHLLKMS